VKKEDKKMPKKKLLLNFPNNLIDKTITYQLVKDYDLELISFEPVLLPKRRVGSSKNLMEKRKK
jgi:hypothetical protein